MMIFQVAFAALQIGAIDPDAAVEASYAEPGARGSYVRPVLNDAMVDEICQILPAHQLTALAAHERLQVEHIVQLRQIVLDGEGGEPARYTARQLADIATDKEKAASDLHGYAALLLRVRFELCGF